jgi:hypothetical protein
MPLCYNRKLFFQCLTEFYRQFYSVNPAGQAATQTRQIHATRDVPCHLAELQRGPIFRFPMQHRLTPYGGLIHGDNQKTRKEFCDPGQEW